MMYGSGSRSMGPTNTDPAPYILSLLIFYTTFRQIEVFAKSFREIVHLGLSI
jgi:hypothetical protein